MVSIIERLHQEVSEPWAVITDETLTWETFWQSHGAIRQPKAVGLPKAIGLRFRVEELFLDRQSGVFGLADSRLRDVQKLDRLYLVVAIAILYSTIMGITVQLSGLRRQVDIHWERGLSYLKMGLRWLRGTVHNSSTNKTINSSDSISSRFSAKNCSIFF